MWALAVIAFAFITYINCATAPAAKTHTFCVMIFAAHCTFLVILVSAIVTHCTTVDVAHIAIGAILATLFATGVIFAEAVTTHCVIINMKHIVLVMILATNITFLVNIGEALVANVNLVTVFMCNVHIFSSMISTTLFATLVILVSAIIANVH